MYLSNWISLYFSTARRGSQSHQSCQQKGLTTTGSAEATSGTKTTGAVVDITGTTRETTMTTGKGATAVAQEIIMTGGPTDMRGGMMSLTREIILGTSIILVPHTEL